MMDVKETLHVLKDRDAPAEESARPAAPPRDFAAIYTAYFRETERWLRAFGIPASDREDVAQETFLVVRRKLPTFDGVNVRGWVFRIAQRTASDHRRRAWFKNLFARRGDVDPDVTEWSGAGPAETLERKESQERLAQLLEKLSEKKRTAFVLFEIEGYTGEEIAVLLGIPEGTVWRRIHMAREEFVRLAKGLRSELER